MEKFVPYEKMSKKEKRKHNNAKRGSWGNTNPVTKIVKPDTIYSRKEKHKHQNYDDYRCSGVFFCKYVT